MIAVESLDEAVQAIAKELAGDGIQKSRNLPGGQGKFRGIDEVQKATCQLMADYGVTVYPCGVRDVRREERMSSTNKVMIYSLATYTFEVRGHTEYYRGEVAAEAFDFSDKGLSKVGSIAYREFLLKLFNVPVEGQPERDEESLEPAAREMDAPERPAHPSDPDRRREAKFSANFRAPYCGQRLSAAPPGVLTEYVAWIDDRIKGTELTPLQVSNAATARENAEYMIEVLRAEEEAAARKKG